MAAGKRLSAEEGRKMMDLMLQYRACGAETREDYLRELANENGLAVDYVRRMADRLGELEDFGALVLFCEQGERVWQ